ncbi:MAG: anthranilate phosphoribosyltransferase [Chloroflexi bacterium]|nr:anthranilate phosphoribosyltransferase [Chloroflexota bacterium]
MIKDAIAIVVGGSPLGEGEAAAAMEDIMTGQATPAQIGAFVTAMHIKGETVEELVGMAQVMRRKVTPVPYSGPTIDTCGTGGDGSHSFNISTAAAFVAAAGGIKVAKHGNRSMTSQCGSIDVLEALGVRVELTPEEVARCLEGVGMGVMFAPLFHPAMKYAAAPRREIGIRTVFNILGPLTNPAGAQSQVLGVADISLVTKMAQVLFNLQCHHALVVHGQDGLDEISVSAPTSLCEVTPQGIRSYTISPRDFGISTAHKEDLRGGTAEENARTMRRVLGGEGGPVRDAVLINAAAALVVGDKAGNLQEGIRLAQESIDSGAALNKLEQLARLTQSFPRA